MPDKPDSVAMRPSDFLRALWTDEPPGYVHVWRLADRHSFWFREPDVADYYAGRRDCYTGVALAHAEHGRHRRLRADEAVALAGLWLDIDVIGGPQDRDHGAPSKDAAIAVARAELEPTILVDSGHGIHAWHLLDHPWRFASRSEQSEANLMSARWYHLHGRRAREAGWHLDSSTRDLARLMRLPGTVNAKGGQAAPVTVISRDGLRYARARLREQTSAVGRIPLHGGTTVEDGHRNGVGELRLASGAAPPADKLRALLVNSPEFAATWGHERPDLPSMSEHDLALCSIAARAGWSDQELADLISAHRGGAGKALRPDYVRRTIERAQRTEDR